MQVFLYGISLFPSLRESVKISWFIKHRETYHQEAFSHTYIDLKCARNLKFLFLKFFQSHFIGVPSFLSGVYVPLFPSSLRNFQQFIRKLKSIINLNINPSPIPKQHVWTKGNQGRVGTWRGVNLVVTAINER